MNKRSIAILLTSVCATLTPLVVRAFQAPAPSAAQQATQQASKADHQQMMDQLHIASLRPGVNARVLGQTNYDEAKANPYPDLPDPLIERNGKKVTSAKMWWNERRPEIVEDFDREVYGRENG